MATTKIADVIVPEVFNPYVIQRTAELSALQQSGIISNNPELDRLASSGGTTIQMPFWDDLEGEDEVLSDKTPLTPEKITSDFDEAVLLLRGKAWGANELAKSLAGSDPMAAIAALVASYWARRRQATLLAELKGVFASPTMKDNILDISTLSDGVFNGETFIDATHVMGDAENKLTAIGVHSNTYAEMKKQNLIEFVKDSEAAAKIPFYQEKRVIVDDSMPVETLEEGGKVYTSYLFGAGAIGLGNGAAPTPTEVDRDSLQGEDILINRQHFLLHPRGVRFVKNNVAGLAPTNEELADPSNWKRVYEPKNIRMVAFKHKL
ncbi:coat protein [Bacillus velezensis]|uniref:major capsid protein n=1 Tax=Bacillus TaxID=1386 RepID=UPI001122094E|nr:MULTISPECIES: major capsid protein [Bacillus]MDH5842660.1 major capsid protein [Bacillus velezensis]MDV2631241.1 major capsid protein [Bacillus velezensis]MDV9183945.1 major capsid protein [Bacillus sp. 31]MDY7906738.1 major capsid protein [Bacillus sp. AG1]TNU61799.1 coat protein [Bacillus velezensis]